MMVAVEAMGARRIDLASEYQCNKHGGKGRPAMRLGRRRLVVAAARVRAGEEVALGRGRGEGGGV
jgi:hypothetical protein